MALSPKHYAKPLSAPEIWRGLGVSQAEADAVERALRMHGLIGRRQPAEKTAGKAVAETSPKTARANRT